MGAAESKPENMKNNNRDWYDSEGGRLGGNNTALAVLAAVGTALLWVAWGVSRYRSFKDNSDERVDHHHLHADSFKPLSGVANSYSQRQKITLKILSYNVCSRPDYEIHERMKVICELVQFHSPHFICFQEFTPAIFNIFRQTSWWSDYYCSKSTDEAENKQYFCILLSRFPLVNTVTAPLGMGRKLVVIETKIGTNKSLVVATSHLKSRFPDPNNPKSQHHQFKKQRSDQAKEALIILRKYPNVVFCGDMNWDEEKDGEFPLLEGWVDAWTELRRGEVGYTFDTKSNKMLKGRPLVQKRLDRILCNLNGFKLDHIQIIGKKAIPDVYYQWNNKKLPVLPSDHYGLFLTMCT